MFAESFLHQTILVNFSCLHVVLLFLSLEKNILRVEVVDQYLRKSAVCERNVFDAWCQSTWRVNWDQKNNNLNKFHLEAVSPIKNKIEVKKAFSAAFLMLE